MKIYEVLFGPLSIVSFILVLKIEDKVYRVASIIAGFMILIVVYLSSNMKSVKDIAELSSNEIKRLNEKIKIHEKLAEHDVRLKNLEGGLKNE